VVLLVCSSINNFCDWPYEIVLLEGGWEVSAVEDDAYRVGVAFYHGRAVFGFKYILDSRWEIDDSWCSGKVFYSCGFFLSLIACSTDKANLGVKLQRGVLSTFAVATFLVIPFAVMNRYY
jgi:hypothetical protein